MLMKITIQLQAWSVMTGTRFCNLCLQMLEGTTGSQQKHQKRYPTRNTILKLKHSETAVFADALEILTLPWSSGSELTEVST